MLKMEDRKVPGRKRDPRSARVFIDLLSRLLTSASQLCCAAIFRLIRDSLWLMMLSICRVYLVSLGFPLG